MDVKRMATHLKPLLQIRSDPFCRKNFNCILNISALCSQVKFLLPRAVFNQWRIEVQCLQERRRDTKRGRKTRSEEKTRSLLTRLAVLPE